MSTSKGSSSRTGSQIPAIGGLDLLKAEINSKHTDCLKLIATNTEGNPSVVRSYISELDNSSFILTWESANPSLNGQIVFDFKKPLSTKAEILNHISGLADSAITDLKSDTKNSVRLEASKQRYCRYRLFNVPGSAVTWFMFAFAYYAKTSTNPISPVSAVLSVASREFFAELFKYAFYFRIFEGIVVFFICLYISSAFPKEISESDVIKWAFSSVLTGIFSSGAIIKLARNLVVSKAKSKKIL
ncbi:hypothetical protein BB560_001088 [Smittium megazygosporum]|uniref:DUF2470 domain-containing protein n=1 Tax=Smittium megazygosporum TaxID=133381 RepID=A0A2T9ZIK7_9FUNG|nr:hypothetical protein BB560_001088 [Smittium megazygosporum]